MTQEQKAKAYDKVREKIAIRFGSNVADEIFSQFEMSEDEKVRKNIIIALKSQKDELEDFYKSHNTSESELVAWLEKQGTPYTKRDIDDAYLKGISYTKNEIEKQYEATYQIRKDIATFIFNRGDIKDRAKWMNYLGIKVSIVEKQGEQKDFAPKSQRMVSAKAKEALYGKPTWSEEDERMLNHIIGYLHSGDDFQTGIDWLKSLKDKVQSLSQPKEWSEEDERMRQYVVNDLRFVKELVNDTRYVVSVERVEKEIDWLKSLKERNTWKPSDEQIELLEVLVEDNNQRYFYPTLNSLYEQLKKLKGE